MIAPYQPEFSTELVRGGRIVYARERTAQERDVNANYSRLPYGILMGGRNYRVSLKPGGDTARGERWPGARRASCRRAEGEEDEGCTASRGHARRQEGVTHQAMDAASARIMDKLSEGTLPSADPLKLWTGSGTGLTCDACDELISASAQEHEVEKPDGRTLRLHASCHELWRGLRKLDRTASG